VTRAGERLSLSLCITRAYAASTWPRVRAIDPRYANGINLPWGEGVALRGWKRIPPLLRANILLSALADASRNEFAGRGREDRVGTRRAA